MVRVRVWAYLRGDEERGVCGYAEGSFYTTYSSDCIRKLKRAAREDLKSQIALRKGERVKYKVEVK